jgi:hypothetical protein
VSEDDKPGNGKPAGPRAVPQHEIDAQNLREKSARLRELRLAQEAVNGPPVRKVPPAKPRKSSSGVGSGKSTAQSVSLADWLSSQEREGRRN